VKLTPNTNLTGVITININPNQAKHSHNRLIISRSFLFPGFYKLNRAQINRCKMVLGYSIGPAYDAKPSKLVLHILDPNLTKSC
jgi:hypothetical protein